MLQPVALGFKDANRRTLPSLLLGIMPHKYQMHLVGYLLPPFNFSHTAGQVDTIRILISLTAKRL